MKPGANIPRPLNKATSREALANIRARSKKDKLPPEAKKLLQTGMAHYKAGDWETAEQYFSQAWSKAPESFAVLTALAQTYAELGVRDKAIELLEKSLTLHGPSETVLAIMGQMATAMSMHDIAEKIWRTILPFNPNEPSYYINLAAALKEQEKLDEALDLLKDTVNLFPENAGIWNSLGVVAQARQNLHEARLFYREAVRLDDKDYRFWSNLASTEEDRNTVLAFTRNALELNPNCHETHMLLANLHFRQGFVAAAWEHWEHRLAPERAKGQNTIFTFDLPRWNGEDLTGKTLLVCGEQGIGDEVFFYKSLDLLVEKAGQLVIAAEPRLVSILSRTYPAAIVEPYETRTIHGHSYRSCEAIEQRLKEGSLKIDYFSPIASTWPHTWGPRRFDIPVHPNGYLKADPTLQQKWSDRISKLGGKLNIGVSWTSQNMATSRVGGYTDVDFLSDIASIDGVNLICLQYGDVEKEVNAFNQHAERPIHYWDDTDLKQDIEANLAIMSNLDFVIGPAIATQMFAMALGVKTLLLARGRPWWGFGTTLEEKELYYAPNLHWIDNHIHDLPYGSPERANYNFWSEARKEVTEFIRSALRSADQLQAKS